MRTKPSIPEPDGDDDKEVFAFFGLAAYCAQVLEQGLINPLVGLQLANLSPVTREEFESAFEKADKRTMGRVLKAIGKHVQMPTDTERLLGRALDGRNDLCHTFFRRHDENMLSRSGRKMIAELRQLTALFQRADQFDEMSATLFDRIGIPRQLVEAEIAAGMVRAKLRDEMDGDGD